jgi:hypothetical protein
MVVTRLGADYVAPSKKREQYKEKKERERGIENKRGRGMDKVFIREKER